MEGDRLWYESLLIQGSADTSLQIQVSADARLWRYESLICEALKIQNSRMRGSDTSLSDRQQHVKFSQDWLSFVLIASNFDWQKAASVCEERWEEMGRRIFDFTLFYALSGHIIISQIGNEVSSRCSNVQIVLMHIHT